MNKLIYVMDVHCGWCYGNSQNIVDIANKFNNDIDLELLVGGMWLGFNAPKGGEGFSKFISDHSPQMEATTGAYVSPEFHELVKDNTYTFSSLEPSCAIVLLKRLARAKTFEFAKAVQNSIFIEGKRLDDLESYISILDKLDIDYNMFKNEWMSEGNIAETKIEFERAKQMARGFPTLLLQTGSKYELLASGYFNRDQMIQQLNTKLILNSN